MSNSDINRIEPLLPLGAKYSCMGKFMGKAGECLFGKPTERAGFVKARGKRLIEMDEKERQEELKNIYES